MSLGGHLALTSFDEALRCVLEHCRPLAEEERPSVDALGLFLSQPLIASEDNPRFDCSAVDGYGVSVGRLNDSAVLVGRAEAGMPFDGRIGDGECVRILTGAVVPEDVDGIAMQEGCRLEGQRVFFEEKVRKGDHVRRRGEEYRAGTLLMPSGSLVTPAIVGLAVAQGRAFLDVRKAPRIIVLTTGNELRLPGEALDPGAVYASNASALVAAIRALGLEGGMSVVGDDPESVRSALSMAFENADLVVTTGGVSVGDRDCVRDCALALGVEEVFWKVAMKPGKPVFFGVREGKPVFGLPGNPVAAMVAFHVLVRPAILRLMGSSIPESSSVSVRLTSPLHKRSGRTEFVRACLEFRDGTILATPTFGQGSHMMGSMARAEALLHLSGEKEGYDEGEIVQASLLKWGLL